MDYKKQNPIELGGKDGASKTVQLINVNTGKVNSIEPLPQDKIDGLLEALPIRAFQARRFVQFVGENPTSKTVDCNVAVAGVNLSDIAKKYNSYIRSSGYELRCKLPQRLIKNRFGEDTMQHLWILHPLNREVQS